jgi:hypothetical protein
MEVEWTLGYALSEVSFYEEEDPVLEEVEDLLMQTLEIVSPSKMDNTGSLVKKFVRRITAIVKSIPFAIFTAGSLIVGGLFILLGGR